MGTASAAQAASSTSTVALLLLPSTTRGRSGTQQLSANGSWLRRRMSSSIHIGDRPCKGRILSQPGTADSLSLTAPAGQASVAHHVVGRIPVWSRDGVRTVHLDRRERAVNGRPLHAERGPAVLIRD